METKQIPVCFICDEPLAPEGFSGEMDIGCVFCADSCLYFATHVGCAEAAKAELFTGIVDGSGVYLGTKHAINRRISFDVTVPSKP